MSCTSRRSLGWLINLLMGQKMPPGDVPHPGKILDMVMLVLIGGQERTETEYAQRKPTGSGASRGRVSGKLHATEKAKFVAASLSSRVTL